MNTQPEIRLKPYDRFTETASTEETAQRSAARARLEIFCQDDLRAKGFKAWETRDKGSFQGIVVYDKDLKKIGTFDSFLTAHKQLCK